MNINNGKNKLVLLCPAWKKYGTAKTVKADTVILHSQTDDVIPYADREELVRNSGLPAYTLIEVGSDHRLADPEPLEMILEACIVDEEDDAVHDDAEEILERDWTGLCYTAALRWARETGNRDWIVIHDTVWSEKVGKRIEHAWCERDEIVVDLVMPVGSRIIERERYYRAAQPEVSKAYSSDDALLLAIKNRHDGPWNEAEQIKE